MRFERGNLASRRALVGANLVPPSNETAAAQIDRITAEEL
jgi:hypothetical protein